MRRLLLLLLLFIPIVLQGATPKLPPDDELKALASDTLLAFNKAVEQKSFAKFYEERFSPRFREQISLEKFTTLFQTFIDKGYDISNVAKSDPVFETPPAIDSDGLLVMKGQYPTKPNKVTFKLSYVNESSAWKLMGINVQATPEDGDKAPPDKELKTLAHDSLLLFNVAIQTKDFGDFYSHISKLWQKQITPEKLRGIFQSFIDKKIDIESIDQEEPVFEGTPAVNQDGLLVMQGSYPTQPKVSFELKYVYEGEGWKLFGINVDAKPNSENATKKKSKDDDDDEDDEDEDNE